MLYNIAKVINNSFYKKNIKKGFGNHDMIKVLNHSILCLSFYY